MNERIKQLEAQCWESRGSHPMGDRFNTEKFAKLIVQECAEVAFCNFHVSGGDLGDLLKQHFGVE